MILRKIPTIRSVNDRRIIAKWFGVALLLLGFGYCAEHSLAQVPSVCRANQGSLIADCPQSCERACNDFAFRNATPRANELCPRTGRGRLDEPWCASWTEGSAQPASPSARRASDRPSQQWCERVSANAHMDFMSEALAQIPNVQERTSLDSFLKTLPLCARALGPQGVVRRLACTGTAAEKLDQDLNTLGSINLLADRSAEARREFCQSFGGSGRSADVRQRLTELQNRTTETEKLFGSDRKCVDELREWVNTGGRTWINENPAMGEVSGPMIDMVEQSANEGQENIKKIDNLLQKIEAQLSRRAAAVTLFSLVCVVPGEAPEPVPQPSASPPSGGRGGR
jgi:hypothetical protein